MFGRVFPWRGVCGCATAPIAAGGLGAVGAVCSGAGGVGYPRAVCVARPGSPAGIGAGTLIPAGLLSGLGRALLMVAYVRGFV